MLQFQAGLQDNKGRMTGALTFIECEHYISVVKSRNEVMRLPVEDFIENPIRICKEAARVLTGKTMHVSDIGIVVTDMASGLSFTA